MPINHNYLRLKGLEPITFWSVVRCSIQLSYKHQKWQDSNPRHPALETSALPTELHFFNMNTGGGNRTLVFWLEAKSFTINIHPLIKQSERRDSNTRPSAPKADALPGCATFRHYFSLKTNIPLTGIEPVPLPRKGNVLTTRRKGLICMERVGFEPT